MAHNDVKEEPPSYTVELAPRGRLVLPAAARKRLGLRERDRLVLSVEDDGSLRLKKLRDQVKGLQGAFRHLAKGRNLAEELIRERRREARREKRR